MSTVCGPGRLEFAGRGTHIGGVARSPHLLRNGTYESGRLHENVQPASPSESVWSVPMTALAGVVHTAASGSEPAAPGTANDLR